MLQRKTPTSLFVGVSVYAERKDLPEIGTTFVDALVFDLFPVLFHHTIDNFEVRR
jgi:hypothetical protein